MTWRFDNYGDENVDVNGVMTAVNGEFSPENVEGSDEVTWQLNNNGAAVNSEFSPEKGMLTWMLDNNHGGVTTVVNGDGELTAELKNMLTCQMNNNGGLTTVNGDGYSLVKNDDKKCMLTWQLPVMEVNGDGEMKSMLTWQMNNGGVTTVNAPVNVNDDTKGVLTWQFSGEVVTDETKDMLTWQNNEEEDENELSKFLEEAAWSEIMTCQNTKVKIINDPYWLPLKFQTGAAYVTINGNEELCGSSFSDSDTSYMAGISSCCCSGFVGGVWDGVADEARGDWGECEDEMLARFLGESE